MEKVSTKALKSSKCFPSERFRSFLYFMAILCLLSSLVYLFVAFVSMKKQLDDVKRELSAISSKESETHLGEKTLSRHKRTTNTQVNLSDLDKRIIALESRYDEQKIRSAIFVALTLSIPESIMGTYNVVPTCESVDQILWCQYVTIPIKSLQQYFCMVLFAF